jgi:hypothetical protein
MGSIPITLLEESRPACKWLTRSVHCLQVARSSGKSKYDDEDEAAEGADAVEFGEVAHAPPKATLKRRHWDEEQAAAAHRARHKEMFLKHTRSAGMADLDVAREHMQVCTVALLNNKLLGSRIVG